MNAETLASNVVPRAARIARRLAVPFLLLLLWQVAAWAGWIRPDTLASPIQVWNTGRQLTAQGQLIPDILVSLRRVLIGIAIGISIATVLGLFAGLSRVGEEIVDAPLQMVGTLPFPGLLPLLIVWLGIGEEIKWGMVAVAVVFPLYYNLVKGIRGVDRRYAELSRSCGVGRWTMIRKVVLPGALPSFLVGLRFSLGVAFLALVVSETVSANGGLGALMSNGEQYLQTNVIILTLVIYALLGVAVQGIVRLIEWGALPWRREFI